MAQYILAADIGGTRARFGLFRQQAASLCLLRTENFSTRQAASFEALLVHARALLFEGVAAAAGSLHEIRPHNGNCLAVYAVAGPVEDGRRCRPPNIGWGIDLDVLPAPLHEGVLLNDFVAQGWACLAPEAQRLEVVIPGRAVTAAPVTVIGAGTGLGMCLFVPGAETRYADCSGSDAFGGTCLRHCENATAHEDGAGVDAVHDGSDSASFASGLLSRSMVMASEGGHASFPFEGRAEADYAAFLEQRVGARIIGDMVLSGAGLAHLHAYLMGEELSPREAAATLHSESTVLEWFARFYGRACRDRVLHTMSLGGVRIAGGVAAANPCLIRHPAFIASFLDCPSHAHLLGNVPVSIVMNPDVGIWGAALYVLHRAARLRN